MGVVVAIVPLGLGSMAFLATRHVGHLVAIVVVVLLGVRGVAMELIHAVTALAHCMLRCDVLHVTLGLTQEVVADAAAVTGHALLVHVRGGTETVRVRRSCDLDESTAHALGTADVALSASGVATGAVGLEALFHAQLVEVRRCSALRWRPCSPTGWCADCCGWRPRPGSDSRRRRSRRNQVRDTAHSPRCRSCWGRQSCRRGPGPRFRR